MKKVLNIITRQQFVLVVIGFIAVSVYTIIHWNNTDTISKLGCFMFLGLCLHQCEEYCFPGGFLWGLNLTMRTHDPARYPGDRLSAGICDVIATITGCCLTLFYLTPLVVGCYSVFVLIEVIVHTIMGFKMKSYFSGKGKSTLYVPGCATSWLIFAPLGISSIWLLISKNYITWLNLFLSAGLTIAFLLMIVVVPVIALRDKKSDYPYPESMQKGYYKKFYD